ncbi:protoporphyrin IX magnesium-chelatase [Methanococcoides vulcani]|uniref:Protoporphyrin IX magnesium-chelatase n=1 Tax=Methanococcoides vulcani TaxID=1353158 RepID=A0A1H9YIG7_9EURY|nr:putative cobaltochelatase [Methanococcoides vulcani]SES68823.1 protoporphyrin IX magnesium-chelatase [Methanococcoides vulcani]
MKSNSKTTYPFTAIVGQDRMKKTLILNAINPKIGGVLIRGEKGTAKSTAVRALANLLPRIEVVDGCMFCCNPHDKNEMCEECIKKTNNGEPETSHRNMRVVDLPVSATEDRVVGTLDIEHAIKKGEKRFEAGVLAKAHRSILYVDEINLLDDHIVDVLLDSAAMGVNTVEREGVSYSHPASFILIGTMNPEEGELRPQLLDRFGLCVDIEGIHEASARVDVIKRRVAYESDPEGFACQWKGSEADLRSSIMNAKELLPDVRISDDMLELIAQICIDMNVDGHRADITMMKTASTISALNGRIAVSEEDIREAAELVLSHRMRRKPFEEQSDNRDKLDETFEKHKEKQQENKEHKDNPQEDEEQTERSEHNGQNDDGSSDDGGGIPDSPSETTFETGETFQLKPMSAEHELKNRDGSGRRSKTRTNSKSGRYVKSAIPHEKTTDIAFDATFRAAAPNQLGREKDGKAIALHQSDIREKVREKKIGNTILFVVDASGSMGAQERMRSTKGAVLSLLIDAYQKRDRVGLVAFKGQNAELLLPPTSSVELANKYLKDLPTGGKTPLPHGLSKGYEIIQSEIKREPDTCPFIILISDGKANVSMQGGSAMEETKRIASQFKMDGIQSTVIDTETGAIKFGFARQISDALGAKYLKLEELKSDSIVDAVKYSIVG